MKIFAIKKIVLYFLFGKPATGKYPFGAKKFFPGSRGQIEIDIKNCIFCCLCQNKCPTKAITVDREHKTWAINRLRCVTCGACVEACPKKCLSMNCCYTKPHDVQKEDVYA